MPLLSHINAAAVKSTKVRNQSSDLHSLTRPKTPSHAQTLKPELVRKCSKQFSFTDQSLSSYHFILPQVGRFPASQPRFLRLYRGFTVLSTPSDQDNMASANTENKKAKKKGGTFNRPIDSDEEKSTQCRDRDADSKRNRKILGGRAFEKRKQQRTKSSIIYAGQGRCK